MNLAKNPCCHFHSWFVYSGEWTRLTSLTVLIKVWSYRQNDNMPYKKSPRVTQIQIRIEWIIPGVDAHLLKSNVVLMFRSAIAIEIESKQQQ